MKTLLLIVAGYFAWEYVQSHHSAGCTGGCGCGGTCTESTGSGMQLVDSPADVLAPAVPSSTLAHPTSGQLHIVPAPTPIVRPAPVSNVRMVGSFSAPAFLRTGPTLGMYGRMGMQNL